MENGVDPMSAELFPGSELRSWREIVSAVTSDALLSQPVSRPTHGWMTLLPPHELSPSLPSWGVTYICFVHYKRAHVTKRGNENVILCGDEGESVALAGRCFPFYLKEPGGFESPK